MSAVGDPQRLSDSEIQQIALDLAKGRPRVVWFTSAAVGMEAGRSGRVIAIGDPAEDECLRVQPTGSKDVLPFSPVEVTLVKPRQRRRRFAARKPIQRPDYSSQQTLW
ncbi:hypothetical protein [Nocardia acidivorans]|uniref:hypothetical protein n=1 Tax=Nocardia acidivorans TaxID=404580 RepID=UPI000B18F9A7|nr:hypothetical protein [Nocardia acidivorans]